MSWLQAIADLLDWLFTIADFFTYWRFNVGLWGGVALAVGAVALVPNEPWRWIIAFAVVLIGLAAGIRWESTKPK